MRGVVPAHEETEGQGPVQLRQGAGQAAARAQAQHGMTEAVLQAIRTDVFNVAAPTAP